ncbi:MAG: hypothetical protein CFK52_02800 [Chloracidobacterium sp. CP2_5A]|nr:MAG: hypothetical protein CFK52_02800 [Chloracidobacterium sp. CP2_5A]
MEALALTAVAVAALSLLGLAALYGVVIRPLQAQARERADDADQWRKLTTRLDRLEERLQSPGNRPTSPGAVESGAELEELRREMGYLKSKLSTLLTPPETPPGPLPSFAIGPPPAEATPEATRGAAPQISAHPFENQRVSDIVARYRGRLRAGHIDALTQHFSVMPNGLFLELEERGERLVFPAQEIIYAGDFEQNYSFAYDCAQPGSGYVVVVSPARLDARGQVIARGRLRVE